MSKLSKDIKANKGNFKGLFFIIFFRLAHFFQSQNFIIRLMGIPIRILYKLIVRWILGIDIPDSTSIGSGFMVYHGQGLVIHSECKIGDYVLVRHNTTIGHAIKNGKCPVIGNNVEMGANAVVIGDVYIGDNAIVAAGAIVVKDVLPGSVVAGNPARVIKKSIND